MGVSGRISQYGEGGGVSTGGRRDFLGQDLVVLLSSAQEGCTRIVGACPACIYSAHLYLLPFEAPFIDHESRVSLKWLSRRYEQRPFNATSTSY